MIRISLNFLIINEQVDYSFNFLFMWFFSLKAQEKKDSLYYKIEEFSDQRKVTKFFHRLIFRREADSTSVKSRTEKAVSGNL